LIIAAAVPWRIWLAPLAGAWWVLERTRAARRSPGSRGRRLISIPVEMVTDLLTGAALVAGSARSGKIIL
jgi:hypothetical protein